MKQVLNQNKALRFLDRLLETCKTHQNVAQKDLRKVKQSQDFISETFRRLVHVNNLLINDEPTDENLKAYMIMDPNMVELHFSYL